jgi:hypothetical protein
MPAEPAFERRDQVEMQIRVRERGIAEIGRRQKGVAGRWQLVELGFTRNEIATRLACGRLHEIYRGVYAIGHRGLGRDGWLMAAVLAGGPEALLSHRAAGNRWGLVPHVHNRVDVTLPGWRRPRSNLRFHQALVPADERTVHGGIPITTVPRTLLDLSAVLQPHRLERAINEAEVLRLTDGLALGDLVERYPGRRGLGTLRLVLADATFGANATRSELEERFLAFVAESGLPQPEVNASLHAGGRWYEVDCLWRAAGLVVELDGYRAHGTRAAFEHDRARARALQAAGWRVFPVTWRQLHRDRADLLRELWVVLAHRH